MRQSNSGDAEGNWKMRFFGLLGKLEWVIHNFLKLTAARFHWPSGSVSFLTCSIAASTCRSVVFVANGSLYYCNIWAGWQAPDLFRGLHHSPVIDSGNHSQSKRASLPDSRQSFRPISIVHLLIVTLVSIPIKYTTVTDQVYILSTYLTGHPLRSREQDRINFRCYHSILGHHIQAIVHRWCVDKTLGFYVWIRHIDCWSSIDSGMFLPAADHWLDSPFFTWHDSSTHIQWVKSTIGSLPRTEDRGCWGWCGFGCLLTEHLNPHSNIPI